MVLTMGVTLVQIYKWKRGNWGELMNKQFLILAILMLLVTSCRISAEENIESRVIVPTISYTPTPSTSPTENEQLNATDTPAIPVGHFQMIIFRESLWSDTYIATEAEDAFPLIAEFDEEQSLFVINLDDIESYDWDQQTILLTQDATERLATAVENIEISDPSLESLIGIKESMNWGNRIERPLYTRAFTVKVDDEDLYSGLFIDALSSIDIDYPAIRLSIIDGNAALSLLPGHFDDIMIDPIDANGNLREIVISQDSERYGQDLDEFSLKVIYAISTSEDANMFRELIRDERIKVIFETANKLQE